MKTDFRKVEICMHDLPYKGESPDGNTHLSDGCSCLKASLHESNFV
jgi:hypothetical protein